MDNTDDKAVEENDKVNISTANKNKSSDKTYDSQINDARVKDLEKAFAKISSLEMDKATMEEGTKELQNKLKLFSCAIHKLRKERKTTD